jgi:hypothetical protein
MGAATKLSRFKEHYKLNKTGVQRNVLSFVSFVDSIALLKVNPVPCPRLIFRLSAEVIFAKLNAEDSEG